MKQHPVWNALSHATVIGSAMFIIFFFIDRVNPAMDFLGSALSKWCLFLYCIASMITALCSAIYLFKRGKSAGKKHATHRQTTEGAGRHENMQTAYRLHEGENAGRHSLPVNDPRYAYLAHGRETLHDTRYDDER